MGIISHKIEKRIEAVGISKTAFAERVGISRETVYNLSDEGIKFSTLFCTAAALLKTTRLSWKMNLRKAGPVSWASCGWFKHRAKPDRPYLAAQCLQGVCRREICLQHSRCQRLLKV